jgi:hypothetical protein
MGAIQKLTDIFNKLNPFNNADNTQRGRQHTNPYNYIYDLMKIEEDRKKAYQECWVMYAQDPRIAAAIDTTAGSATNGGFHLQFNAAKSLSDSVVDDANDIILNVISTTKLMSMISGIAKELLILGDVFMEVIIDSKTNEIIALKKLPARTIERIEDEFGTLQGYVQKDEINQVICSFEKWQILHLRWNHFSGQKYGISLLRSIRGTWKKLKMTEEDLVVRRRTRAGVKLHHYGSSAENPLEPDEVDEYIKANQTNPLNVRTDWYSNGKWKIDVLKSDDGVSAIEDILHLEDILFVGLRTPKGLLGLGDSSNKATLERQEIAYIRLLNEISGEIADQLRQVFDLAISLKGLDPTKIVYEMVWGEKSVEDINKKAERLVLLGNTGHISKQTVTEQLGYDYEDERYKIEKEIKKGENVDYVKMQELQLNPPTVQKGDIAHNSGSSNAGSRPTSSKQQIPGKGKNTKTGG